MTEDQKRQLQQKLWAIADELRGKMNADDFRDYILGFIFYKYLSEKMHLFANTQLKADGKDFATLTTLTDDNKALLTAVKREAISQLGYFLEPADLFHTIAQRANASAQSGSTFILDDLTRILANIQNSTMGTDSEDDFDNLFEDLDLTSSKLGRSEEAKNTLVAKILFHLDSIDFRLEDADSDLLGDAYEYLIGQFASKAGKKAGEFYTPQEVSTILAGIVTTGKTRLKSVYDPTCGSGSLLLRVAKEAEEVTMFYGQEMNRTTYNLARMNMILHGVHYTDFDIKNEDTLEHPQHEGKKFEIIVANPPFSANWSANQLFMSDDRFSRYGKLAPSSKADYAFIQHMLHHLDDNGQMAVVMPHGALFRSGAEGHIRQYLIETENVLDAVIGLPANIFYGTSIPTCILVFKKCREHPDNVLFIDASQHFEKVKNQNMLRPEDIERVVQTYRTRQAVAKFSHIATLEQIKANDYNLNIPRYVDTFEEDAQIDLDAVANQIKALDADIAQTNATIAQFCQELGIATPF